MPLFQYDSFSRRGTKVSGTIDAPTLQAAKEMLQGQGLMPTDLKEVKPHQVSGSLLRRLFERRIDLKTKVQFTKQFAVLLRSGVPLLQAIDLLSEQIEGQFQRILIDVKDGLKAGESLAHTLNRYPHIFSNVYRQLVRAGEASGKLELILDRLVIYLERSEETKKRIQKAMNYPLMMLGFAGAVVVGMLTFLVPRITSTFTQMGKELPWPTKFLMNMSDLLLNHYPVLIALMVSVVGAFLYWKSTEAGKRSIDQTVLRLPLIGYFARTRAVVQFSKTLGMLLESGVNLSEALDIVCNIVDNSVLVGKLRQAREKIIKEGKIAQYLKDTGIFPSIASYMISTGEQAGKLAEMLLVVGDDYDVELTELADSLTEKINPIMMIVMGLIVTFLVLAIFMPLMQMGDIPGM